MKIRFTTVVWEEISEAFSIALKPLEFLTNNIFENKFYGADVTQFLAVAIAVGDPEENQKFSKTRNKAGSFKHPITSEKVKFVSFALELTQEDVINKNANELKKIFCSALLYRLDNPEIKIPKGFDYESFSNDMKNAINKVLVI